MQAKAFVGEDASATEHHVHRRREPTAVACASDAEIALQSLRKRFGELLSAIGNECASAVEECAEFRPRTRAVLRHGSNPHPAGGGFAEFAAPLVKFSESNQSVEIALIGFERGFKRTALSFVIALKATCFSQIEPQCGGTSICCSRRLEVTLSASRIVPTKRVHAENIVSDWMIRTQPERRLGFTNYVGETPLLLRVCGSRQMLLDCHPHGGR